MTARGGWLRPVLLLCLTIKIRIMEEKVIVQLHTEYEDLCYEGISVDTALQEMWYDTCDDPDEYEGCKFTIRGTEKEYVNNGVLFHYCFDKGRITVEELLGMLEVS